MTPTRPTPSATASPRRAPHRAEGPLDATYARRAEQPPEGDDMSTRTATPLPRRSEAQNHRAADTRDRGTSGPTGLWILPVMWKTPAMRSAQLSGPEGAFPTTPRRRRRPQAPQASSSMSLEHHVTSRILKVCCDTEGRELTDERRPTSVPLRRNRVPDASWSAVPLHRHAHDARTAAIGATTSRRERRRCSCSACSRNTA